MKKRALLFVMTLVSIFIALQAWGEEKIITAVIDSDGVQRVEIVGGSYFFKPDRIIVKVNVPVELKLRKESGIVPHNFVIKAPEAGIDLDLPLGTEPKVVTFIPTKTGIYQFYCSKKLLFFESHREKGMKGMLEVVK
ncbi:MAG: cupredoxin domain-containing protein [Desulfuromonadaceae bacterium]|jgi:plastocyanin domain-containing protein|nr:cupredoxin domain-containing protein [Desulfuromonadaceae bacterium]